MLVRLLLAGEVEFARQLTTKTVPSKELCGDEHLVGLDPAVLLEKNEEFWGVCAKDEEAAEAELAEEPVLHFEASVD
eukprot:3328531-Amphidinium_carterae.1